MKISFNTPLSGTDQSGAPVALTADEVAALSYVVLFDTVNPPVKKYPVPAKNLQDATVNADGSKHVVATDADLGIVVSDNLQYFVSVQDALGTEVSAPSAVLPFERVVTPGPVANFTVA